MWYGWHVYNFRIAINMYIDRRIGGCNLQEFLENGNLNPGIHLYKVTEFEEQFVLGFGNSESRKDIYEKFVTWMRQLIAVLPPDYAWLDGSYLTMKTNPNDLDLVVFYQVTRVQDAGPEVVSEILRLIEEVSRTLRCDAYFCYLFDGFSPEQLAEVPQQYRTSRTYWMGQFGFDRGEKPKGIVQLSQEEILLLGGELHE